MFTPQRGWWSKGKAAADTSPAPTVGGGDARDRRSFRDAGPPDDPELQCRDGDDDLAGRISELEKELHEYQYNMGILLIEKREWSSKYEEMIHGLATTEEILKGEQASHLIAVSKFEKREENMRKALGVEKQCVADDHTRPSVVHADWHVGECNGFGSSSVCATSAVDSSPSMRLLPEPRVDWWDAYGGCAFELQSFAKLIVGLCASSSGCECNWSTFEFLERALHEMRAEIAEVKFTSDKKFTDARAMEATVEEKYLETEGKLRSVDAKLAEASRKSTAADRNLEDVEDRERKLLRELLFLNTEREAHENDLAKQRKYLQDWENKLQEGQTRLVDVQRFLNERENRETETERVLKKKEQDIVEARRVIGISMNSLKDREDDISTRLRGLASKEKDAKIKMENLEKKEKDLLALEEDINAKERVGIQKLVNDHHVALDAKKREFEVEMVQKRNLFDEEVKIKLDLAEGQKIGIECREQQAVKRERALEIKMEKLNVKEKELDSKLKALKKWEESIKDDERRLIEEKQQLGEDTQGLVVSKVGLECLKTEIESEKQKITRENENLKVTKEEREQHLLLQSELKREIEEYRKLKESLATERVSLRQEKEKFERDWEALDEKRMALEAEQKHIDDEKSRFKKWQNNEEGRLKIEELEVRGDIQRELEGLRLKKEAFESTMEHERSEAYDSLERVHADIARELELRKHELEMNIQKKQDEMENKLRERETEFEKRREFELNHIKSSGNLNESKIRKLKMDKDKLEREKEQLSSYGKKLEAEQLEIQKDIETLRILSRNLKHQREEFIEERKRFLGQAEQCKVCKNCGIQISKLEPLGLQPLTEIEDAGNVLLPILADGFSKERLEGKNTRVSRPTGLPPLNSGVRISWLQKCSRLFNLSPGKNSNSSADGQAELSLSFGARLDGAVSEGESSDVPAHSYEFTKDSFDSERVQLDSEAREKVVSKKLGKAGEEPEPSLGITDTSVDIMRIQSDRGFREREYGHIRPSSNEHNEMEGYSLPENDSQPQPQPSKQRRHQSSKRGRSKTIKRTRSIKAVVEDAKAILGETSEMEKDENPHTVDSLNVHEESQGDSGHQLVIKGRQKRRLADTDMMVTSDLDAEDSEVHSETVSVGGRRKRRNVYAPVTQTPGEKRYNFRCTTIAGSAVTSQAATADQFKGLEAGNNQQLRENEIPKGDVSTDGEGTSNHVFTDAPSSDFLSKRQETSALQKTNVENIFEVQEISSQKIVQFETEGVGVQCGDTVMVEGAALDVGTTSGSGSEDEDDGYEDEEPEGCDASIGKKLWSFFTL